MASEHYTLRLKEIDKLLVKNKALVNNYNYGTLLGFSLVVTIILLLVTVLSFLPLPTFFASQKWCKVFFGVYFILFASLLHLTLFGKSYVSKHTIPFMYVLIVLMNSFGILCNLVLGFKLPYVCELCFLILIPLIVMDHQVRLTIVITVVYVLACAISFSLKDKVFTEIDAITLTSFYLLSVFLGYVMKLNQMSYLDIKQHEMDKSVEIMKAKTDAKSNFLANMSHEIRTPINAILGFNEMILRDSSEDQIKRYAEDIQMSGKTLLSIINDILDFSKIEANKLTIYPYEYYLDSMINDVANMISPRAKDKNLDLLIQVDSTIPNVLYGDEVRIKQCMLNLLTNAVKYTNEGSVTLNVGWQEISDKSLLLKVRVSDTGVGIREEDMPTLFHAFERIDEKHNRTVEGTGLGMTIVQRLLEKMNSNLYVHSEYGKGSRFSFNLQQNIIRRDPVGDFSARFGSTEEHQNHRYRESFHAPKAHILVVDDMKINLEVMRSLLRNTLIQIDTAQSGAVALEMVAEHRYDMIFIDHRMPLMDGIDTLRLMKRMENNKSKDTPCIALTANAIQGAREMYLSAGFMDYLSKPVDYIKLEKMLMSYLDDDLVESVGAEEDEIEELSGVDDTVEDEFYKQYCKLNGVSASDALHNCSDVEVLRTAVFEYYDTIDSKADQIEQFAKEKDYHNYTILVHAIKSSSRLIGAMELSELAKYLEKCGDDKNEEEIAAKTPRLLELYRSYKKNLAPVVPAKKAQEDKELMDVAKYKDAKSALLEYIQADDFITVENIVNMIEDYQLPDDMNAEFELIKQAVTVYDKEELVKILKKDCGN